MDRIPGVRVIQLVRHARRETVDRGVTVLPAGEWLAGGGAGCETGPLAGPEA